MAIQLPSFSFLAQPGESPAKGLLQGLKAGFSISEQMSQNKTRTAQREQMQQEMQRQQLIQQYGSDPNLSIRQKREKITPLDPKIGEMLRQQDINQTIAQSTTFTSSTAQALADIGEGEEAVKYEKEQGPPKVYTPFRHKGEWVTLRDAPPGEVDPEFGQGVQVIGRSKITHRPVLEMNLPENIPARHFSEASKLSETVGKSAEASREVKANISFVERSLEGLETTPITKWGMLLKNAGRSIGIKSETLAGLQQGQAGLVNLTIAVLQKFGGKTTDFEYGKAEESIGTLSTSPEGRSMIFDFMREVADQQILKENKLASYRNEHDQLLYDRGGDTPPWQIEWNKHVVENPIIIPRTVEEGRLKKLMKQHPEEKQKYIRGFQLEMGYLPDWGN